MVVGAERALGPLVACGVDARRIVGSRRLIATAVFPGAAMPSPPPGSSSSDSTSSDSTSSSTSPLPPPRMIMNQVSEDDADVDEPTAKGALFMVDRAHLVSSLASHVERELAGSVALHWGAPLASLDAGAQVVRFESSEGHKEGEEFNYDLLVACDGGSSAARLELEKLGLLEVSQLPSPVSLTDYKTFHGEIKFVGFEVRGRGSERNKERKKENEKQNVLTSSKNKSKIAKGLDDAGADELGLDTTGRGSTFAMFVAPPPAPGVKGATYAGSMAVHRRPEGKGWSGLLSQPPGVFESLKGSPPGAYAPLLDGILGVQIAAFPASWRAKILEQLAAEPGSEGGGDIGRLAKLLRASALAVPSAGVALVGDAATTNTPQLGQGAASAIEDAAMLAAEVTRSLVESEKENNNAAAGANDEAAGDEKTRTKAAVARGLECYDAKRRRARFALQKMEQELAVTNRPPPVDESVEDAEARAAWKAFFEEGKRQAAKKAETKKRIAKLLPFSRRARAAAHMTELSWWNEALHGTTPYDVIYESVRSGGKHGEDEKGNKKRSAFAVAGVVAATVAAVALTVIRKAVVKA